MSDHDDVLRMHRDFQRLCDAGGENPAVHTLHGRVATAIDATLAELATLRAEVGILSAAKAGARYIAERDTLRQRLAEVERIGRQFERDARKHFGQSCENLQRAERAERELACREEIIKDHLAKILHLENRVDAEAFRAKRAETALREAVSLITGELGADWGELHQSSWALIDAALAPVADPGPLHREEEHFDGCSEEVECDPCMNGCYHRCGQALPCPVHGMEGAPKCEECGEHWPCPSARSTLAPVAEQPEPGSDARSMPAGTLVTCEHCPWPHAKDDDGIACLYPKVATQPAKASTEPPDHV
jgi:hypothetical protein